MSNQRKFQNFLLQPFLQVRLGIYNIVLTTVFSVLLVGVIYTSFERVYDLVLELTNLREEVGAILNSYLVNTAGWMAAVVIVYLVLNILMTVVYTHKFVGPTVAFRRMIAQLRQGQFSARVKLRNGDAFQEVAEDLNGLAEDLERKKHGSEGW